jgi:hypothetical protein
MNRYFKISILLLILSQLNFFILFLGLEKYLVNIYERDDAAYVKIAPFQVLFFCLSIYFFIKANPSGVHKVLLLIAIIIVGVLLLINMLFIYALLMTPERGLWQGV